MLRRQAAAAVSVGTYTAMFRSARRREAPTEGGEGRGHIVSPRAQLVLPVVRQLIMYRFWQ